LRSTGQGVYSRHDHFCPYRLHRHVPASFVPLGGRHRFHREALPVDPQRQQLHYKEDGIERNYTVTVLDGACLRAEEAYESAHHAHVEAILDYPSLCHAYVNDLARWHNENDRIAAMTPGVGRHVEATCRGEIPLLPHWEDRGITVIAKIGDRCEYRSLKPSRIHGLRLLMGDKN
jgi:hypothetical protein